jgi:hypothetical protein
VGSPQLVGAILSRYYGRNPEQVQDFAGPNGGACSLSDRLLDEGTKTMEFKKTKKTYIMSFTTQQPNSEIHAILRTCPFLTFDFLPGKPWQK